MFLLIPINENEYRPPPIACQCLEDVHTWFTSQALFTGLKLIVTKKGVWLGNTSYAILQSDDRYNGQNIIDFYHDHPSAIQWKPPPRGALSND